MSFSAYLRSRLAGSALLPGLKPARQPAADSPKVSLGHVLAHHASHLERNAFGAILKKAEVSGGGVTGLASGIPGKSECRLSPALDDRLNPSNKQCKIPDGTTSEY